MIMTRIDQIKEEAMASCNNRSEFDDREKFSYLNGFEQGASWADINTPIAVPSLLKNLERQEKDLSSKNHKLTQCFEIATKALVRSEGIGLFFSSESQQKLIEKLNEIAKVCNPSSQGYSR